MRKVDVLFEDQSFAQQICEKAIAEHVCYECKCTDMEVQLVPTGVICFYLNGDDIENHKRVIQFMMDNDLIRKTKTGRYYNNSFKLMTRLVPVSMVLILKGKSSWMSLSI